MFPVQCSDPDESSEWLQQDSRDETSVSIQEEKLQASWIPPGIHLKAENVKYSHRVYLQLKGIY